MLQLHVPAVPLNVTFTRLQFERAPEVDPTMRSSIHGTVILYMGNA